jgi:hypothetical protein
MRHRLALFEKSADETRKEKVNCLAFLGLETESMCKAPTP